MECKESITLSENRVLEETSYNELLINIYTTYLNLPLDAAESEIYVSLGELMEFIGADLAVIFHYDHSRQVVKPRYYWSGVGFSLPDGEPGSFPMASVHELTNEHLRGKCIFIPDIQLFTPGLWKDTLTGYKMKSHLSFPLHDSEGCVGFIAFSWLNRRSHCTDNDKGVISAFARMVVNISRRRQNERRLNEKIRSLKVFYHLSKITEREGITMDELCSEAVECLRESCQHPELACARMVIEDREFCSENYMKTPWMNTAPIIVNDTVIGSIETGYIKEKRGSDDTSSVARELFFLEEVTDHLAQILRRIIAERKVTQQIEELRRWYEATIDRETRIVELKNEVNDLLACCGKPLRYNRLVMQ